MGYQASLHEGLEHASSQAHVPIQEGFTNEHRNLFDEWLVSNTFKSVVIREQYLMRLHVLHALANGHNSRQLLKDGVCSLSFIQKTRQNYSLNERGELYYHARKGKATLLVIPDDEIFDVIVREHNAIHHQGTSKTWYEISRRYHGIPKRAVDWVLRHCLLCHDYRPGPRPAPTQKISSHEVMERVQMDLIDMRREPDRKYRWILHIKDHYSRFCMLYPLRRRRGKHVVRCFLQWIATMGPPMILQTDNGVEFVNALITQVAVQHQILIRRGQSGRPRSQGLIERANGHVRNLIAKWCNRFCENRWSRSLPSIALACNTSVHSSTRRTPFEMVFGRAPSWQRLARLDPLDPTLTNMELGLEYEQQQSQSSVDTNGPPTPSPVRSVVPPMALSPPSETLPSPPSPPPSPSPSPSSSSLRISSDDPSALVSQSRKTTSVPIVNQEPIPREVYFRRGTRVSVSLTSVDRKPLDVYRLPALILSHRKNKGYRVCTAWGILSNRVPARHVLPLPEGHPFPARAFRYLQPGRRTPRVDVSFCMQQLRLEEDTVSATTAADNDATTDTDTANVTNI